MFISFSSWCVSSPPQWLTKTLKENLQKRTSPYYISDTQRMVYWPTFYPSKPPMFCKQIYPTLSVLVYYGFLFKLPCGDLYVLLGASNRHLQRPYLCSSHGNKSHGWRIFHLCHRATHLPPTDGTSWRHGPYRGFFNPGCFAGIYLEDFFPMTWIRG